MVKAYKTKKKKSLAIIQWQMLPEHTMGDVINDVLYVNDPPTIYHQRSVIDLTFALYSYIKSESLGRAYPMETGVWLNEKNVVQPDFVFVANENINVKIVRKGIVGAPDLILEILSPSTRRKDKTLKKDLFEEIGVQEYWIIDPETKNTCGYFLENRTYREPLRLKAKIHVRIFDKTFDF